jgi:hypothetical protein
MFYHGARGMHPNHISPDPRNKRDVNTLGHAYGAGRFAQHALGSVACHGTTDAL